MPDDGAVLLAGASGLVGGQAAEALPAARLACIGRRAAPGLASAVRQQIGPVDQWPALIAELAPSVAVCALGTTIRVAGSKQAFRAVDFDLVLAFANAARDAGASRFILVSSVGASAASPNFYLSVKGQAEEAVKALGFARVDVLRPGLLRGARKEQRAMEGLAMRVAPFTDLLTPAVLDRYRSIAARDVARAAAALCDAEAPGQFVHHNREMLALSAGYQR